MQITKIITDDTLRELREHGTEEFPFQYNQEEIKKYDEEKIEWHWHMEFEFVVVMKGSVFCLIGNQRIHLDTGEGLFINTRIIHSIENCNEGVISNVLFSPDLIATDKSVIHKKYIKEFLESDSSHIVLKCNEKWQEEILRKLDGIFAVCRRKNIMSELDVHIRICDLWMLVSRHSSEIVKMEKMGISLRSQSRLRKMMEYIETNYFEKIYLEDIARAANISKSEAIRCFSLGMQMSPVEYLNQYRLHRARIELETTEDSIMRIAVNVGIVNSSYFTRIFKKVYGITPKEARSICRDAG